MKVKIKLWDEIAREASLLGGIVEENEITLRSKYCYTKDLEDALPEDGVIKVKEDGNDYIWEYRDKVFLIVSDVVELFIIDAPDNYVERYLENYLSPVNKHFLIFKKPEGSLIYATINSDELYDTFENNVKKICLKFEKITGLNYMQYNLISVASLKDPFTKMFNSKEIKSSLDLSKEKQCYQPRDDF